MHTVKQGALRRSTHRTPYCQRTALFVLASLSRLIALNATSVRSKRSASTGRRCAFKNGYRQDCFGEWTCAWEQRCSAIRDVVWFVWRWIPCDKLFGYWYTIIFSALIMSATGTEAADTIHRNDGHSNVTECSKIERSPKQIVVNSSQSHQECRYFIQAPVNHYITLNFTNFKSFRRPCHPNISIVQVESSGQEKSLDVICAENVANEGETYFESTSPEVIVTFHWGRHHPSGFTLRFNFHPIDFVCTDGAHIPGNLKCNGETDCQDSSDEAGCSRLSKSATSPYSANGGGVMEILGIVVVVVVLVALVLVLFGCIFKQCRLPETRHFFSPPTRSDSSERNQLHSSLSTPQTSMHQSEVVYVQTPSNRLRPTTQLRQPEFYGSPGESYTPLDRDAQFPPPINRTGDGEEGYTNSQRALQECTDYIEARGLVHAPPNKTVHEGESPPPYRAHSYSMGHLDKPAQLHRSERHDSRLHGDLSRGHHERGAHHRGGPHFQHVSHKHGQLVTPAPSSPGADPFSFSVRSDYSSPRTARLLSAPDSSQGRTSTYSNHSSRMGPPPYPPPEYSAHTDIDNVFISSTVAPTTVTSSVASQGLASSAAPCLHAS